MLLDAISYTFGYHNSLCALQLVTPLSRETSARRIRSQIVEFVVCSKNDRRGVGN